MVFLVFDTSVLASCFVLPFDAHYLSFRHGIGDNALFTLVGKCLLSDLVWCLSCDVLCFLLFFFFFFPCFLSFDIFPFAGYGAVILHTTICVEAELSAFMPNFTLSGLRFDGATHTASSSLGYNVVTDGGGRRSIISARIEAFLLIIIPP
ncbi:hypothetical protein DM02DRAFT_357471 [Periconia macrospinosa]|uniref:Uncharacterized protein n=1 Tax=Periconia macrospinosa TaxID=97972 RepID=A0A2V1EAR6_9PLEO|nr:hypothetical protein DM02DRAFT_357471 [Periconia macrospinosa]